MTRIILLIALMLMSAVAQSAVREIKSTYHLYLGKVKLGEVSETFVVRDNQYHIESVAKPVLAWLLPTLTQTSSGRVTAEGLRPEHFTQSISNRPAKNVSAAFDWKERALHLSFNGNEVTHELKPMTFDSLTLKYQFMFTRPEGSGSVLLTNGKKVEEYQYQVMKQEQVTTPYGKLEALHVAKIAKQGESKFDLWLGTDQHYVPIKVLAQDEHQLIEQLLSKITVDDGG